MQLYIYNNDTIILTCSALHSTSILYSIASDVARNLFQGSNSWGSWASAQVGYTWVKSPDGCLGWSNQKIFYVWKLESVYRLSAALFA